MTYWLGKSSLFLPTEVRDFVVERYQIVDAHTDVSVITERSVTQCFLMTDDILDETLLVMCIRICRNLGKKLVVFHSSNIPEQFLAEGLVYAHIDLTSANCLKALAALETKLGLGKNARQNSNPSKFAPSRTQSSSLENNRDILLVRKMLEYVDEKFTTSLREKDVAEHCHLSVSYFSRIFHQQVGQSFRNYLINKRIEYAKQMLKTDSEQRVSSIAFSSGFNDLSYFSRVFKKRTGMSPSTYRNLRGTIEFIDKS
ncbi:helix-turn-helix transcriptional regulator [Vibrio sp. SCSIO 43140]|uniref:helix-turn-helix domain-containing protein n=1 Tax=Vibrio sp. SCSIO 43140 TaxID=2819100 RepID=UPI0020762551|nr:AraC family transcriptional regulator [Vibrio sp. SCSIO 43140]USD61768.1 helix-turn-helix transcriptional regulator [Vibrio sp. SCSIO 43140]